MDYKSTSVEALSEKLKEGIVEFEYTKKDGTVRKARGTMLPDYLPEPIPEEVSFEVEVIDILMKEKNIPSIEEYAKANGLQLKGIDLELEKPMYVFTPIKRKHNDKLFSYYDVDKDSFRSFIKENFLGIL